MQRQDSYRWKGQDADLCTKQADGLTSPQAKEIGMPPEASTSMVAVCLCLHAILCVVNGVQVLCRRFSLRNFANRRLRSGCIATPFLKAFVE